MDLLLHISHVILTFIQYYCFMQKEILVIDDDIAILEVVKIILQEKNYRVITISDSTLVQGYLMHHNPSIILLDFWMSGLNGKKIVAQIKNSPHSQHIPIVMISANHEVRKIAKEIHANDFLAKPFDITDLTSIVEKYM